ncbi:hypothetical protein GCM10027053_21890 [Intrasporangium mesophilum]
MLQGMSTWALYGPRPIDGTPKTNSGVSAALIDEHGGPCLASSPSRRPAVASRPARTPGMSHTPTRMPVHSVPVAR